ncbi:hypothetical protein Kpol_219p2 [Vanderwaltozyma polyspora DSM 70294]|uniref:Protein MUM2 n=1 Tax=Vanderwaltozyma polyspora (strain ATCC 22028 / DSM 70294 / BCRC 21397 / CBS 2163 / NBRC 10782 / NRRL Y-8283 / UCD 57-17) TaxID=436907 RepID=A7TTD9_VANPO|nr:uncharacterized protein Kpol_219p2 [Vanderwaltozyma polyspora DSM 70294]EDO14466.1 hypothetical protein Kpol_219p2 [Vanderwaltozyma polyspora DSM 70294]
MEMDNNNININNNKFIGLEYAVPKKVYNLKAMQQDQLGRSFNQNVTQASHPNSHKIAYGVVNMQNPFDYQKDIPVSNGIWQDSNLPMRGYTLSRSNLPVKVSETYGGSNQILNINAGNNMNSTPIKYSEFPPIGNLMLSMDTKKDLTSDENPSKLFMEEDLRIKEEQLNSLTKELKNQKDLFNKSLDYNQLGFKHDKINQKDLAQEIAPDSVESLFKTLSSELQSKEEALSDLRDKFECVLTALALDTENPITKYGNNDTESIARRIVLRIENLSKENQEMAKLLSFNSSKQTQIELELVRKENVELKERLRKLHETRS